MSVVRAYHGTWHRFEAFDRTKDVGFHFASRRIADVRNGHSPSEDAVVRRLRKGGVQPRVLSCDIDVGRPLVSLDDPMRWNGHHVLHLIRPAIGEDAYAGLNEALAASGRNVTEREPAIPGLVRTALLEAGFDSVVYRNMYEGSTRRRAGTSDWSIAILDPARIRIVDHDHHGPGEEMSLPPAIRAREAEIANWRSRRETFRHRETSDAFEAAFRRLVDEFDGPTPVFEGTYGGGLEVEVEIAGRPCLLSADPTTGTIHLRLEGEAPREVRRLGDQDADDDRLGRRCVRLAWQGTESISEFEARGRGILARVRLVYEAVLAPTP